MNENEIEEKALIESKEDFWSNMMKNQELFSAETTNSEFEEIKSSWKWTFLDLDLPDEENRHNKRQKFY